MIGAVVIEAIEAYAPGTKVKFNQNPHAEGVIGQVIIEHGGVVTYKCRWWNEGEAEPKENNFYQFEIRPVDTKNPKPLRIGFVTEEKS